MAYQIETTCICGDPETSKNHSFGAVSVPIYQTATFAHPGIGESTGHNYTRESNPTRDELEKTVSALEGAVELGPGLLTSIYDGIQRPLDDIMKETGSNNLKRGVEVPSLKRDKKWQFVPTVKAGDSVEAGDIIGTVQETLIIEHKIMVPYGVKGTVKEIKSGEFTVEETVALIETENGESLR